MRLLAVLGGAGTVVVVPAWIIAALPAWLARLFLLVAVTFAGPLAGRRASRQETVHPQVAVDQLTVTVRE